MAQPRRSRTPQLAVASAALFRLRNNEILLVVAVVREDHAELIINFLDPLVESYLQAAVSNQPLDMGGMATRICALACVVVCGTREPSTDICYTRRI